VNRSDARRFDDLYGSLWGALHRGDDPDLSQHERQLLAHIPSRGGLSLTALARHLLLPKSTASVVVKDLSARGLLTRSRRPGNERELSIELTDEGRKRVRADTVLDLRRLGRALGALSASERAELLGLLERLAAAAAREAGAPPGSARSR
jgi:DNA-binding MarR family transcriptional regulator